MGLMVLGAIMSKALEFVAPALFPLVPVRAFDDVAVFECGTGVRVVDCIGKMFVLVRIWAVAWKEGKWL